LRSRVSHLGLGESITMPGHLSESALSDEYRKATIFVLPSWSEGFPTVLAEAMDAGLPIITTRIRGAADHLIADENALFVQPRDARGLASAMIKVLQDQDLRSKMASANQERIRIFEPGAVAQEYLEVLQSVVREAKPTPCSA